MIDLDFDKQHIWHPYTSMDSPLPVYPVTRAEGVRLILEDGSELIDGMASWWSAIHGYNNPVLNQAASEQLGNMAHIMFGGITHAPAVELAQQLVAMTPPALQKVFYSDSGSVAVEVAIKMALQYWMNTGKASKKKLLTIRNGYHGDTFAAMSVCDPVTGMHEIFAGVLQENIFADAPQCRFEDPCQESDLANITSLLEHHHQDLAAVILEPVVQGAGRMFFYSPDYLVKVRALCDEYEVLLIADEIATGFGRSGKLFACEHADICPDILCLGKALTGGYMTLAATLCTEKISEGISRNQGVFMHGPTFMANPLACACALASIKLLKSNNWQKQVARIEAQFLAELAECRISDSVTDVRILGAIGVVEMKEAVDMAQAQAFFVEKGVWIRPFGKLVYLMPPYIIEPEDLAQLNQAILEFTRRGANS
ncbi:MAG: adenosylmethionine--8-amino-7-oxononanoate transaminase [Gammaproteobacteria bacterium]|nr:adenosylmethionine--8-amino-7-oxononanoate transaminase [Gammaproteobacteria bacterium]